MRSSPLLLEHVTKVYPAGNGATVMALDDVSLELKEGEIFGLLGPNGAGKTTLINCAIGLIPFNSGSIGVFGHDVVKDYVAARSKIGFVYQEFALDNFFRAKTLLLFHRGLYNRSWDTSFVEKILRQLDLWQYRDKLPDQLSGGMKRRLAIAKALVHEPPFVILDEPTAGVDIEAKERMWEAIRAINSKGITVLLTTHYIEEAETMCDRIGIINFGKFVKVAATKSLVAEMGRRVLYVQVQRKMDELLLTDFPFQFKYHAATEMGGVSYEVVIDRGYDSIARCLAWFQNHGAHINDVEIKQSTLEDVFRAIAWGKRA